MAGEDSPRVLDSTGVLALNERPRRLVIIGGGYIGLEFAFMFHAFGSEITILDGGDRFLPREDRDIAEEMLRVLNSKGIKVLQGVKIEAFRDNTADTSARRIYRRRGAGGRRPRAEHARIGLGKRGHRNRPARLHPR